MNSDRPSACSRKQPPSRTSFLEGQRRNSSAPRFRRNMKLQLWRQSSAKILDVVRGFSPFAAEVMDG